MYNRRGQLFTTLSDLLWVSSSPVSTSLPGQKISSSADFVAHVPFEALLKNTSFLTAHLNWTLNIGFCQLIQLSTCEIAILWTWGAEKTKVTSTMIGKKKLANSIAWWLDACLRACSFSLAQILIEAIFSLSASNFSCQIMIVNLFRSLETSSHHQGEIISSAKAGPSYLLWYMIVDGCDPTDSSVILALTKPL